MQIEQTPEKGRQLDENKDVRMPDCFDKKSARYDILQN